MSGAVCVLRTVWRREKSRNMERNCVRWFSQRKLRSADCCCVRETRRRVHITAFVLHRTVQWTLCLSCSSPSNFVVWFAPSILCQFTVYFRAISCGPTRSADQILFTSVVIVKDANCEINSIYLICSFNGDAMNATRSTWNVRCTNL